MKQLYFLIVPLLWCAAGCNLINPSEQVPTFVHVDSFTFSGNPSVTGTNTHKITNVYAYFNGQSIGIFDLPVTFPVIADNPGTLQLYAGIDFDGLTGYEVVYPLYFPDTLHLVPQQGKTINYSPVAKYSSSVILRYNETFEGGTNSFKKLSGDTTVALVKDASNAREGSNYGYLKLKAPQDSAINISNGFFLPPGQESYLEIDYKATMPLQVGLSTILPNGDIYSEYLIGLNPRTTYNKVYIGLKAFATGHQGSQFSVLLRAVLPDGQTEGDFSIDNVKVVSY